MLSSNQIHRQTIELVSRSALCSIEGTLVEHDYAIVRTGCPINDTIAVRTGGEVSVWCTGEPDVLVNALRVNNGLVDPAVAWAPTTKALAADRSHLIVAIPDLNGHRLSTEPDEFEAVFVSIPGRLLPLEDAPSLQSHWRQLHRFLALQSSFAVQGGQGLDIHPIYWDGSDYPSVSVVAEPGDHMEHGEGFYVFDELQLDHEPIAPYRQSSLDTVADAVCDLVSRWGIPPVAVTTTTYSVQK